MKLMKKALASLVIYLCSFQLAFGEVIIRRPASVTFSDERKEDLKRGMEVINEVITGKLPCSIKQDVRSEEKEEEIQEQAPEFGASYLNFLDEAVENSCRVSRYEEMPKEEPKEESDCKERPGILHRISKSLSKIEIDEEFEKMSFKITGKGKRVDFEDYSDILENIRTQIKSEINIYNTALGRAKFFKKEIQDVIATDDLSEQEKKDFIQMYIENVVVPIRDVAVALRPYSNLDQNIATKLLITLPEDLYSDPKSTDTTALLKGKSPGENAYYMKLVEGDGGLDLIFDEKEMVYRDIHTIMKHPSPKSYIYALRVLTIQMMINQIKIYDDLIGNKSDTVELPDSCVERKENGNWSKYVPVEMNEYIKNAHLETLLTKQGLYEYNPASDYYDFFLPDEDGINPLEDGMLGSINFDRFLNARKGLDAKTYVANYRRANFDDFKDFSYWLKVKKGEADSYYYKEVTTGNRNNRKKEVKMFRDLQLLKDIITPVADGQSYTFEVDLGDKKIEKTIYPFQEGASEFLAGIMKRKNAETIEEIIPMEVGKKLKRNVLNVDMPSLYSPDIMRNWAVKVLHGKIKELRKHENIVKLRKYSKEALMVKEACLGVGELCRGDAREVLRKTDEFIESLKVSGKYIPVNLIESDKVKKGYKYLFHLWRGFRDTLRNLPEGRSVEYNYLLSQIGLKNPWAMSRLGYLIAKHTLKEFQGSKKPTYKQTVRGPRVSHDYVCHKANFEGQIDRLEDAARTLKLHKIQKPNFMSTFIRGDDAKAVWAKINEDISSESDQIFTAKVEGKPTYKTLEEVSFKTVLSREEADQIIDQSFNGKIESETQDMIDEVFDTATAENISKFREIVRANTDEEREELVLELIKNNEDYDNETIKEEILIFDNFAKRPFYIEAGRKAAVVRKAQVEESLEALCGLKDTEHEQLKEQFQSTMNIQNKLNESLGLPAIPEEITDEIMSMSSEEWRNAGLSLAGFGLVMFALAAGSCAVVTGGLCGLVIAGAAAGGIAAQGAVAYSEYGMKSRADKAVVRVDNMADLGFTETQASEEVARGWFWTIFEAVSIIPLLGLFARGVHTGSKMTKVALKSLTQNYNKLQWKENFKQAGLSAKAAAEEAEVQFAKLVLGYTSYAKNFKEFFGKSALDDLERSLDNFTFDEKTLKTLQDKIAKIRRLKESGKITTKNYDEAVRGIKELIEREALKPDVLYRYTSTVLADMSFKSIDKHAARTVTQYFGSNPKELRGFMNTYMKKYLPKKNKSFSYVGKARIGFQKAKNGDYAWGTNWIRRAWFENTYNLAKNKRHYMRLMKELETLPASQMEAFVAKNMDQLSSLFAKAPLRKRDFPYLLIQGGPHIGGLVRGRRLPGLQEIGEAVVIRKMFNARERLVAEGVKAAAREALGMKAVVAADSVATILRGFQTVTVEQIQKSSGKTQEKMLKDFGAVLDQITTAAKEAIEQKPKLAKLLQKKGVDVFDEKGAVDFEELQTFLFNAETMQEQALAEVLLGSVDVAKLLSKEGVTVNKTFFRDMAQIINEEEVFFEELVDMKADIFTKIGGKKMADPAKIQKVMDAKPNLKKGPDGNPKLSQVKLAEVQKFLNAMADSSNLSRKVEVSFWDKILKADEKLMKDEFQFLTSQAMRDLIKDKTIRGTQKYIIMMKMLLLKDRLGVIELM